MNPSDRPVLALESALDFKVSRNSFIMRNVCGIKMRPQRWKVWQKHEVWTSLFPLFYVTCEFNRFLHWGWAPCVCKLFNLYIEIILFLLYFQILFISGLALVIGLERTFRFFFQKHKLKGSSCFLGGVMVVLFGWPLIGMIIETYGFVLLFR